MPSPPSGITGSFSPSPGSVGLSPSPGSILPPPPSPPPPSTGGVTSPPGSVLPPSASATGTSSAVIFSVTVVQSVIVAVTLLKTLPLFGSMVMLYSHFVAGAKDVILVDLLREYEYEIPPIVIRNSLFDKSVTGSRIASAVLVVLFILNKISTSSLSTDKAPSTREKLALFGAFIILALNSPFVLSELLFFIFKTTFVN